jgi:hypothetical protein
LQAFERESYDPRPKMKLNNCMQVALIILLCILSAICYGIVHDQITARICVEYFTIGHPPVFHTDSPTLLAFGWGVIATWWVGLFLGIPLACAARFGSRPKVDAGMLIKPILYLLSMMAATAVVSGTIGFVLASDKYVTLFEPLATEVPRVKHVAFLVDLWAHSASYLSGFVGGLVLIVLTWRKRARLLISK